MKSSERMKVRSFAFIMPHRMIKILLQTWRIMPVWLHVLAAKLRPRFGAAVAALIFDERGRVLLFKHTYRKFQWGIPAGGLEFREKPADAIVREFFEETGMQIQVEKLLTVVNAQEARYVTVVYLCEIISGEFKESHEVSEMKYFNVNQLPKMLFAEKELILWAAKEIKGK